MKRAGLAATVCAVVAVVSRLGAGTPPQQPGTLAALEAGERVFLSRCVSCHGPDGDEVPAIGLLTGRFRRPYTNAQLAALVRSGIPGTAMAPIPITEEQAAQVVGYLRWAAGSDPAPAGAAPAPTGETLIGNVTRGRELYGGKGNCATCHQIDGVGGHLGPDLSDVGDRLTGAALAESLRDPDAVVPSGATIARVVDADGSEIIGRLLDQDTDVIHVVTSDGRRLALPRATVRRFDVQTASGMPSYADLLSAQELADIVAYLQTLRRRGYAGNTDGVVGR